MFKSIESFESAFPYFLGRRLNYTSQAASVSSPVKIRLWLYYIWLARKSYLQMLDPIHNKGLRLAPVITSLKAHFHEYQQLKQWKVSI